jgi:hypothetical protein
MEDDAEDWGFDGDESADGIKEDGESEVAEEFFEVIVYGEIFLADEVGEDHHAAVTDKCCPGRAYVSMDEVIGAEGDPPEIKDEGDDGADHR